MTLSGALWDGCVKAIMLDPEHYEGHIKVFNFVTALFYYVHRIVSRITALSNYNCVLCLQDHPKDDEFLNTPIKFFDEIQTIFGSGMATSKFAMGSNEVLGTNKYMDGNGLGMMEGPNGKPMGD